MRRKKFGPVIALSHCFSSRVNAIDDNDDDDNDNNDGACFLLKHARDVFSKLS